jgi:hypothetical protein
MVILAIVLIVILAPRGIAPEIAQPIKSKKQEEEDLLDDLL